MTVRGENGYLPSRYIIKKRKRPETIRKNINMYVDWKLPKFCNLKYFCIDVINYYIKLIKDISLAIYQRRHNLPLFLHFEAIKTYILVVV